MYAARDPFEEHADDFAWCEDVIRRNSHSFYRAFSLLPPRKRNGVFAMYAFCRAADDCVDVEASRERLESLQRDLERFDAGGMPRGPLWRALGVVFGAFDEDTAPFFDMLEGQRRDLAFRQPADLGELEDYGYYVAGSVGLMLLPLLRAGRPVDDALRADAVALGVAMQLTNILRDVGEDWNAGRVYLPAAVMEEAGLVRGDLAARRANAAFRTAWERVARRSEELYLPLQRDILRLDGDSRLPTLSSLFLYRGILDQVRADGYSCLEWRSTVTGGARGRARGRGPGAARAGREGGAGRGRQVTVMQDVVGMGLSLVYVLAVLAASSLLARHGMGEEGTRKLVHVALGGWWVVAALFFTSPWWAAALPAAFIVVNALAWRKQKLAFMARGEGEDTPGTVYYAVSLTLIALFSFGLGAPYVGALGVFCMAFGDGLAAVLGRRFGRRPLPGAGGGKSLAGSAAMLGVSFVSCAGVLLAAAAVDWEGAVPTFAPGAGLAPGVAAASVLAALGLAVAATVLEAASPEGLDNLSVPLGVTGLYAVLFLPAGPFTPAVAGVLLSGAVALAALRLGLLTVPGALGAVGVGALAFVFGGWPLWLLLMWFFGSSNVASRLMRRWRGGAQAARKRSGPRKLRQVLANSVPFLACALAYAATGEAWFLIVAAGALAASTADTWASEVGMYSRKPPVNIVTREPMQRGLSGGVSPLGLAATTVGAVSSAFLAMLLFHAFGFAVPTGPTAFLFVIACGIVGSVVDSFLGVLLQAKYRAPGGSGAGAGGEAGNGCGAGAGADVGTLAGVGAGTAALAADGALVEAAPSRGAAGYTLVSGYAWVTNDAVNLLSGIAVVALGLLVALP